MSEGADTSSAAQAPAAPAAPAAPTAQPPLTPSSDPPKQRLSFREHLRQKDAVASARAAQTQQQQSGSQPSEEPGAEQKPEAEKAAVKRARKTDQEALAWARMLEESTDLPDDFLERSLRIERKGEDPEYKTVREIMNERMMLNDYSRNMQELKRERDRYKEYDASWDKHFESIKDPEFMLRDYEDRGYGETLEKVAELVAIRRANDKRLARAAGMAARQDAMARYGLTSDDPRLTQIEGQLQALEERTTAEMLEQLKQSRARELELRKLQRQNELLTKRQTKTDEAERATQQRSAMQRSIDQLLPAAMHAYGIEKSGVNEAKFYRLLADHMTIVDKDDPIRKDMRKLVQLGCQLLREESQAAARAERNQRVPTLPVHPQGSAAPPIQGGPGGTPTSKPMSTFRQHLRELDKR